MCSIRNSMCFPVYDECMTYMEEGCQGRSLINENSRQGLGLRMAQAPSCSPKKKKSYFKMKKTCFSTNKNNLETHNTGGNLFEKHQAEDDRENHLIQLIALQNANGSWDLSEDLAKALDVSLADITAVHPTESWVILVQVF
nr:von Willebrand factor A domain-containing protein 5A-like [Microcebus murinus]